MTGCSNSRKKAGKVHWGGETPVRCAVGKNVRGKGEGGTGKGGRTKNWEKLSENINRRMITGSNKPSASKKKNQGKRRTMGKRGQKSRLL